MAFGQHSSKEKEKKYNTFIKNYKNDEFLKSFLTTKVVNGEIMLHFYTFKDNYGDYIKQIIHFFKNDIPDMLGKSAFGFIYIYDDMSNVSEDKAIVYTLKKGLILQEPDYYFSPFSKNISPTNTSYI